MLNSNTKHGLSDEEITRIWEDFRGGKPVDEIAKENGVRPERAERVVDAVLEVYEDDVEDMITDRKAGMTKNQIAEKYGYAMPAVRYYLQGIRQGQGEKTNWNEPRPTFKDEWNATCRRLNPKAWEGRDDIE